jgi:CDP-diacylglycerol--serine O-phosphatidyltransferase
MRRPFIRRRQSLNGLSFNRMIPNILTLLGLSAGLTGIRFAIQERWEEAVLAIVIAAVLDGLDGRIARLLNGTSKFGAELDSLSDFLAFGVAPAMLHYMWVMRDAGSIGWVLVCLYAVCCALRLARFNTLLDAGDRPAWAGSFFVGVPAPAAAGLVMLPVIVSFTQRFVDLAKPGVSAFFLVLVSALMVSRLPTFSFKRIRIPNQWILPTMLTAALLAAAFVSATWETMAVVTTLYLFSIPFSIRAHRRLMNTLLAERSQMAAAEAAAADAKPLPGEEPERPLRPN